MELLNKSILQKLIYYGNNLKELPNVTRYTNIILIIYHNIPTNATNSISASVANLIPISVTNTIATNVTGTVPTNLHNKKVRYKTDCYILQTSSLVIISLFIIAVIYYHYTKRGSKLKNVLPC